MWFASLVFIIALVFAIALSVWACCRLDHDKLAQIASKTPFQKSRKYKSVAKDDEDGSELIEKTREELVKEMAKAYDPAEDYDPEKTIVYKGKRLSVLETRILIDKLRHPEIRRKRVGGGFVNQVLNPETNQWMEADRYAKRYPFVSRTDLRDILVDGNDAEAPLKKNERNT